MKSLLLLIAFYQLAIATKIATVVVDACGRGTVDASCQPVFFIRRFVEGP